MQKIHVNHQALMGMSEMILCFGEFLPTLAVHYLNSSTSKEGVALYRHMSEFLEARSFIKIGTDVGNKHCVL